MPRGGGRGEGKDGHVRSKAGFVDAVVDVVVGPGVGVVDFLLQGRGVEVDLAVLFGQEVVEFGVEHADDLAGFVVDDGFQLGVVEGGHGEAAFVLRVDLEVDVAEVGDALVDGVWGYVFAGEFLVGGCESPPFLEHLPVDGGEGDDFLEALQLAGDESAVGPGAGVGDVEMVSPFLRWELGAGLVGDEVAEGGLSSFEFSGLVGPIGD